MEDPRDSRNDEDLLTEDSEDDFNDLLKEFETKYEKLKSKKKSKESTKAKEEEILSDDENKPTEVKVAPIHISQVRKEPKPSTFISKLYQLNKQGDSKSKELNYSERKFSFEGIQGFKPIDLTVDELEPTSNQYIRKRYIDAPTLKKLIHDTDKNIKILKIDKLLAKTNKMNNYAEPEYNNWGFVGFLIKKFPPKVGKDKKKFMKCKVGDFNRSVDLMMFGKAFEQYWKLKEGDVILILNPRVNKFKFNITDNSDMPKDIEGFNLGLDGYNTNSVIHIGTLRDYGTCSAIKKSDNLKCEQVINIKLTTLCEFHLDQRFKGNQNRRMELNSGGGTQMRSPKRNKQSVYANRNGSIAFLKSSSDYKTYNEDTTEYHFDGSEERAKYYDPKLLNKNTEKRRKIMNEKANQALKEKLMANLSNISKLKSLNLIKTDSEDKSKGNPTTEGDQLLELKQRSFSNNMISKIGYDPTISQQVNLNSPSRKRTENKLIKELYELSSEKSKIKSLETSSKDIQSRKEKWQSNLKTSKKYEQEIKQRPINNPFGVQKESTGKLIKPMQRKGKNRVIDTDEDEYDKLSSTALSDESDIEIEFDTEEMKQSYNNRINLKK